MIGDILSAAFTLGLVAGGAVLLGLWIMRGRTW